MSLACETLRELPVLSAERRAAIRALPATLETHAAVLAELPWLDAVECCPPPAPAPCGPSARVVAWNAELTEVASENRQPAAARSAIFAADRE